MNFAKYWHYQKLGTLEHNGQKNSYIFYDTFVLSSNYITHLEKLSLIVNLSYSIMNGLCKSADIRTVETTHIGSAIR
jgi:hypothetical protein